VESALSNLPPCEASTPHRHHGRPLFPPNPRPPGATSLPFHCHRPGRQHVVLPYVPCQEGRSGPVGLEAPVGSLDGGLTPQSRIIPEMSRKGVSELFHVTFCFSSLCAAGLAGWAVEMYHTNSDSCQCNNTQKQFSFYINYINNSMYGTVSTSTTTSHYRRISSRRTLYWRRFLRKLG
jgi:hypothetical protein